MRRLLHRRHRQCRVVQAYASADGVPGAVRAGVPGEGCSCGDGEGGGGAGLRVSIAARNDFTAARLNYVSGRLTRHMSSVTTAPQS